MNIKTPRPKTPSKEERKRTRGTLWQCPYCRQAFPLADVGEELVPVQIVLVNAMTPVGHLTAIDGTPVETNVTKLLRNHRCRRVPVLIPHIAMCIPAIHALGRNPDLYLGVLVEPPGAELLGKRKGPLRGVNPEEPKGEPS